MVTDLGGAALPSNFNGSGCSCYNWRGVFAELICLQPKCSSTFCSGTFYFLQVWCLTCWRNPNIWQIQNFLIRWKGRISKICVYLDFDVNKLLLPMNSVIFDLSQLSVGCFNVGSAWCNAKRGFLSNAGQCKDIGQMRIECTLWYASLRHILISFKGWFSYVLQTRVKKTHGSIPEHFATENVTPICLSRESNFILASIIIKQRLNFGHCCCWYDDMAAVPFNY